MTLNEYMGSNPDKTEVEKKADEIMSAIDRVCREWGQSKLGDNARSPMFLNTILTILRDPKWKDLGIFPQE